MTRRIALIDADILCYRIGFAYEKEASDRLVRWQVDKTMNTICDKLDLTDYKTYLTSSDKSNFRFAIDPDYKGNRTAPKPKWYGVIREHLINDYGSEVVTEKEADDAISIEATTPDKEAEKIIVSLDKDLEQIPGQLYKFSKDELLTISKRQSDENLCRQLLTGDPTDNIEGIKGIGKKRSKVLLESCSTRHEMLEVVEYEYQKRYDDWEQKLQKVGALVFLQRYEEKALLFPHMEKKQSTQSNKI